LPLKQQKKRKLTQIFFFPVEEESWQALDIQKKGKKKKKPNPKQYGYHFPLVASQDPTKHTKEYTIRRLMLVFCRTFIIFKVLLYVSSH